MFQKITRLIASALMLAGAVGCSWVKDDLTGCPQGCSVQFTVDPDVAAAGGYNASVFAAEVDDLTLFVFSSDGTYVGRFSEQGDALKQSDFTLDVPVAPGHYKIVAWTGLEDSHYIVPDLQEGVSKIEDLDVLLERDNENRQNDYLHPVWHGMLEDVEVKQDAYRRYTVNMSKANNGFVLVLQDMKGGSIKGDTFTYEIVSANGHMAHDFSLMADDKISYGAYFVESANLSDYDSAEPEENAAMNITAARAELNTLRLMKDTGTRLVIRERLTERLVLDIDLVQYILLTRERYEQKAGLKLTDQQYLDYEDSFSLMFVLMPTGSIVNPYAMVELRINGWVVRPQDADL